MKISTITCHLVAAMVLYLFEAVSIVIAFQVSLIPVHPHKVLSSTSMIFLAPSTSSISKKIKHHNHRTTAQLSIQQSRRSFVQESISNLSICIAATIATTTQCPHEANAANNVKGAAEYDFEFYMRTLINGNKKEGSIQPSQPPPTPPPRHMNSFVRNIVNESFDESCIAMSQLLQVLKASYSPALDTDISNKMILFRNKVAPVYKIKQPWEEESAQDEYYFDLSCYSLFRIASELIPSNYVLRDQWIRSMGKEIYNLMKRERLITVHDNDSSMDMQATKKKKLTEIIPTLIQLLESYKSIGLIKEYRLGEKNDIQQRMGKNIFDEYDDEDIESGLNVNFLVSLFNPATLASSLQITGEGSRFSPDFVSPTIAALLEEQCELKVEFEGYFVDEEYRPNPKDFFPNEQLLQFTLSKKSSK